MMVAVVIESCARSVRLIYECLGIVCFFMVYFEFFRLTNMVAKFKYLGSIIQQNGDIDEDISQRIQWVGKSGRQR